MDTAQSAHYEQCHLSLYHTIKGVHFLSTHLQVRAVLLWQRLFDFVQLRLPLQHVALHLLHILLLFGSHRGRTLPLIPGASDGERERDREFNDHSNHLIQPGQALSTTPPTMTLLTTTTPTLIVSMSIHMYVQIIIRERAALNRLIAVGAQIHETVEFWANNRHQSKVTRSPRSDSEVDCII